MIELVGKHTVRILNKNRNIVDERESYNVITTKGRERLLDIWAENFWSSDGEYRNNVYGFEEINIDPTVIGNGDTRYTTLFDIGTTLDPYNNSGGRNLDSYASWHGGADRTTADSIFKSYNNKTSRWDGGPSENSYYFNYWHGIDLCRVDTVDEQTTVSYIGGECEYDLYGSNLKYDDNSNKQYSLTVEDYDKIVTYSINSDYNFDRETGVVTFFESGYIDEGDVVKISYKWHDTTPFEDGVIGMYMYSWPEHDDPRLRHNSYMGMGRYSVCGGEYWEDRSWPWWGKPHNNYRTFSHNGSDYISCELFNPHATGEYDRYFFTYPYIINKPTNFAFLAGFYNTELYMQKWRFLKPKYQPQVPQVIALGDGTSSPSVSDIALGNETARWNVSSMARPENAIGSWRAYIDYDECNGMEFKEVGLFYGNEWRNSTDAGWTYFAPIKKENCDQLFSRTVYDSSWTKTNDQMVELTYEILLTPESSSSSSRSSSSSS